MIAYKLLKPFLSYEVGFICTNSLNKSMGYKCELYPDYWQKIKVCDYCEKNELVKINTKYCSALCKRKAGVINNQLWKKSRK